MTLEYASATDVNLFAEGVWQQKVCNDQELSPLSASTDRDVNNLKHQSH